MPTKHVFVSGKVQGVFFRDTTVKNANERGVTGWVRNLPDGRVEAVFEGDEDDVQAMVDFVHEGPPAASVDDLEVEDAPDRGPFEEFEKRRTPSG
jgi:acylphosphatase